MIKVSTNKHNVELEINIQLLNNSSQNFDLEQLKTAIISQSKSVFNTNVGKFKLNFNINVEVIKSRWQCSTKKILFQIVNTIAGNNPAEADFKGLRVKLNKAVINDIILNKNSRTIPHEIGHLLGWDHPHARAKYESVNLSAHKLEQELNETERKINLMSQTWYTQKAGFAIDEAIQLSEKQIELLLLHNNSLNHNFHLRHFLFWKKIM